MLAHLGLGSRKEVKKLIRDGLVLVNGEIIKDDDFVVDENNDEIIFNDETLNYEEKVYFLLNKPKGCVSACYDDSEKTVLDLISGYEARNLFPVGRLDKDTTGLLLISNDGELAHKLLSPKHHVSKVYEVELDDNIDESLIAKFSEGVVLEDNYKCKSANLFDINKNKAKLEIFEGKYHQVKRMFKIFNLEVVNLNRISFGKLTLPSNLAPGEYIKLKLEDII